MRTLICSNLRRASKAKMDVCCRMLVSHLRNLSISYFVAVAASTITLALKATALLLLEPGYDVTAALPFAVILFLVWFGIAALLFVAPAIIIAYPLALIVARLLKRPMHTALAGACLGPFVGSAVTVGFLHLVEGTSYISLMDQMIFLAPAASVSGASIGWVVAKLDKAVGRSAI